MTKSNIKETASHGNRIYERTKLHECSLLCSLQMMHLILVFHCSTVQPLRSLPRDGCDVYFLSSNDGFLVHALDFKINDSM